MSNRKPDAWKVICPKGHEFDVLIFPTIEDAEYQSVMFAQDIDITGMSPDEIVEAEQKFKPIPLYPADDDAERKIAALTADRDRANHRVAELECRLAKKSKI